MCCTISYDFLRGRSKNILICIVLPRVGRLFFFKAGIDSDGRGMDLEHGQCTVGIGKSWPSPICVNKVLFEHSKPVCSHTVYGCFLSVTVKLSSCNALNGVQRLRHLLFGSLHKSHADPSCRTVTKILQLQGAWLLILSNLLILPLIWTNLGNSFPVTDQFLCL